MPVRVAIFEDNKLVRDSFEAILNGTDGFICTGVFSSCNNLHNDMLKSKPDVVLMDIEMNGINGIEATQMIRQQFPEVKILIQTVFEEEDKIFAAVCAGASGYILKNDPPHKFIEAINEVYSGGAPISSAVAKKVLGFFANQNIILVSPGNEDYHLSEREKEILHLMVQTFNYKAIAEKAFISYETVRTHVKNIYKKLHVTSRSEAVTKAIQQGLF